ncbi:hypothetical protein L0337_00205, partial [candidate division KSB1 bacterium]|nr:hypothetical protein [candidate division KSB1 bacterium]
MKKVKQLSRHRGDMAKKPVSFAAPSSSPSPELLTESDTRAEAVGTPQKLIAVLGMHRSGTSAITRALQV